MTLSGRGDMLLINPVNCLRSLCPEKPSQVSTFIFISRLTTFFALLFILFSTGTSHAQSAEVGTSPWGPEDEIGRLNLMTAKSRAAILSRVSGGTNYDLSVEYFIGMPSWQAAGDPHYRIWMTS